MLNVKTKRYQLPTKIFIQIGFATVMRRYWWAFVVPAVLILAGVILQGGWWWLVVVALLLTVLYLLFWYIQFYGITQLPQGKTLFEKFSYQFENERIIVKKNEKEGMVMQWTQIQSVERREDALLLWISKFQFFYLPHTIFNHDNDRKWVETLLRRKKLLS